MYSNKIVIEILKYINDNIYEKISIDELSLYLNYNKDYIMRLFKREISLTITQYINMRRIFNSLSSYRDKKISILNIALSYGFYSQEYYSEIFHKILGVSPLTYYKFSNHKTNITMKDVNTIQNSITKLEQRIRDVNYYITNIKPERTVKVLTIFK